MLGQKFSHLPEVVKNLMIINGLFFLATWSLSYRGIDLSNMFALHQFQSPDFQPHQLITHMFMHANFTHLFFNMFTLWMFGKILENKWGSKRFLTYYLITGFGAALIYVGYIQFQIYNISSQLDTELINQVLNASRDSKISANQSDILSMQKLYALINVPMLGASGAVYGLLLAFGMIFPNTRLEMYVSLLILISFEIIFSIPLPIFNIFIILLVLSRINPELNNYIWYTIPIQAKYFVLAYGILELYLSIMYTNDGIAHLAHLGGMIFGIILLKYWKKKGDIWF